MNERIDEWELAMKMDRWMDKWMTEDRRGQHTCLLFFMLTSLLSLTGLKWLVSVQTYLYLLLFQGSSGATIPKPPVPSVSLTTCPS